MAKCNAQKSEYLLFSDTVAVGLSFDNVFPRSRVSSLNFCTEHAKRTCCERRHTDMIKRRVIQEGVAFAHHGSQSNCFEKATRLWCSLCDADVGSGQLKGICEPLCEDFYSSCRDDLFTYDEGNIQKLNFCAVNALHCSPLSFITSSPVEFCNKIGFNVVEGPANEEVCYSGTPSAVRKGEAPKEVAKPATADRKLADVMRQFLSSQWVIVMQVVVFAMFSVFWYRRWKRRAAIHQPDDGPSVTGSHGLDSSSTHQERQRQLRAEKAVARQKGE
eukprot:GILK01010293.1.p1 GENE.GILK01010293.1~~GILK01010293.1.p1  ORF type:complete len:314 (+),score=21.70 GILK01010293.1:123-944(+)